ncbi:MULTISPECIES: Spy/CpxP family protein refolding chaperone [unclassified Pseudomonas]|uniref:Spy/CpxP family protein refolding chaperone n=1 Tax=unclassified Pseudomonas TaxID=196821 RepID=UPI0024469958|nr:MULTISPECIES: Spy/CpxP family protein refolding chaperone [unclassified Pseudomonas]MDH0896876.1 Spy/CpxP family protein refolding chaperone [Pseudomonas sp. GD03875]MDH1066694.1 Spy/CpxP family protein refolding chaperone [Pseudomonas sp. GD03985]
MRKTLTALLLAASLPAIALAMPDGAPGKHGGCERGMHSEHREHGKRPFKDLDLSAEQRQQIGKLMREQRDAPREITRKYLDKLPKAEQDAMKKELENSRLEHQKAIRAILTPEQQKTFDAHKAEMEKRRTERQEFEAWKAEKAKKAE